MIRFLESGTTTEIAGNLTYETAAKTFAKNISKKSKNNLVTNFLVIDLPDN